MNDERNIPVKKEEDSFERVDAASVRRRLAEAVFDFKNSWRALARVLYLVQKHRLYVQWGYEKFDTFTAAEAHIRKPTAVKLIRSYTFLKEKEPLYLREQEKRKKSVRAFPSLEAVSTLQRAQKALPESGYQKIRRELLEEGKDPGIVKRDVAALVRKRKEVDLSGDRQRSAKLSVKRFLQVLNAFKNEVKTLHTLPYAICADIDALIETVRKAAEEKQEDAAYDETGKDSISL